MPELIQSQLCLISLVLSKAALGFGEGQRRLCSGQGWYLSVRSFWLSYGFLHQALISYRLEVTSSSACVHKFPHLLQVYTRYSPLRSACKVFIPPSTQPPSPLTEGMQARQNLGAPVPIQADAAHQELLVHWLDLRARAVLPLCHGAHDGSCHSHQPV